MSFVGPLGNDKDCPSCRIWDPFATLYKFKFILSVIVGRLEFETSYINVNVVASCNAKNNLQLYE